MAFSLAGTGALFNGDVEMCDVSVSEMLDTLHGHTAVLYWTRLHSKGCFGSLDVSKINVHVTLFRY